MPKAIPTPPKPVEEMTDTEKATYRAQLEAALDALRPVVPAGSKPGMVIGEGFTREYVPYTREYFLDIEARRKDVGPDGNLMWPDYKLENVMYNGSRDSVVKINGVAFGLIPGRICKLPTPFYDLYMQSIETARAEAAKYDPPDKPQQFTVYRQIGQWEKAPTE